MLRPETPVVQNPGKRMAGQIMGRIAALYASDFLAPVAKHWQAQIQRLAKAQAITEALPEMDYTVVNGTAMPEETITKYMTLFLRSTLAQARNQVRNDATRSLFMMAGYNTDVIDATGDSILAHTLTALQYGDYVAYYVAMAYGVDPTDRPPEEWLKETLTKG
jgi:glucose/mannose-6-phosphate isomerase